MVRVVLVAILAGTALAGPSSKAGREPLRAQPVRVEWIGEAAAARPDVQQWILTGGDALPLVQVPALYRAWLSDVRWILTDSERIEFLTLDDDDARDRFIEQFWLRRDPTPLTLENEARVEHYRRLAEADRRFAADAEGSRNGRGRVLIRLGVPDEVSSAEELEVWTYRETGLRITFRVAPA